MRTWYYARNGKQFGPVGLDQIKLMLGTGGLDREDLVWREGMPVWLPAGEVEELNPPVVEAEIMPPPLPASAREGPVAPAEGEDILPGTQPILVSYCLAHAWRRMKTQIPLLLAAGALYLGISIGALYLAKAIDGWCGYQPTTHWVQGDGKMKEIQLKVLAEYPSPPAILSLRLLKLFMDMGFMRLTLNVLRGEKAGLAQIFGEWRLLPKMLLTNVFYSVLVLAGLCLMLVPGIFAAVIFWQFRLAILERNMGVLESLSFSARITRNSLAALMVLTLVSVSVIFAGELAMGVGTIFAVPFMMMVQAAAYHWLTKGARDALSGE